MQGLRKGFLTLHSRRSSIPNFCHLYPEYRFFPSTTSRSEISANPVARVVVNSRIPSRNSAFSRIPHCMSAKSRIPRMLDSSSSSVKTWRPCGFSDSAMTKKNWRWWDLWNIHNIRFKLEVLFIRKIIFSEKQNRTFGTIYSYAHFQSRLKRPALWPPRLASRTDLVFKYNTFVHFMKFFSIGSFKMKLRIGTHKRSTYSWYSPVILNYSLRSRRLEVLAQEKTGAREGDTQANKIKFLKNNYSWLCCVFSFLKQREKIRMVRRGHGMLLKAHSHWLCVLTRYRTQNLERATPILSLCYSIFTNRFIFRTL